jgi:N-acetylmuramoyl-L-alanine amidase
LLKYKVIILLFFVVNTFIISETSAYVNDLPLLGKVIYIDPGHGGRDPGTSYGGLLEKDLNLSISFKLRDELMSKGALVYMTRESDIDFSSRWDIKKKRGDLYRRILMMEKASPNIYLSIHINWYDNPIWRGAGVYYHKINKKNETLAQVIQAGFKEDLNSKRSIKQTDLYLYSNTKINGVLLECGYLSNPNERYLLQQDSYQKEITKSITKSIIKYFSI